MNPRRPGEAHEGTSGLAGPLLLHRRDLNLERRFDAVSPVIPGYAVEGVVPQAAGRRPDIERVVAGAADQGVGEAIAAHVLLEVVAGTEHLIDIVAQGDDTAAAR